MKYSQSERYLLVDQFIRYCEDLNVETNKEELEHYEKIGVMLPLARIIYPHDYVVQLEAWHSNPTDERPDTKQWTKLLSLFDETRILDEDYADMNDEELIDSFDREMGKTPYLIKPALDTYRTWSSYEKADHYCGFR